MKKINGFIWLMFNLGTAMVGYHMHSNFFKAILDFVFAPLIWCKWLIMHQVTLKIVQDTFEFFLK